ncbi:LEM-3-like GIY-YIG domain-containing protein, partial [Escherichia coli]|uniref:LEM-3-like GIY-YIG domain-containing protein n=1 Tax=Escherichia coli TaxID=562 RepID=UPI003D9C7E37
FYIGKGKGNRPYHHLRETKETTENLKKYAKIKSIRDFGVEPVVSFWERNLSETQAYDLESKLILTFGRKGIDETGILTNMLI